MSSHSGYFATLGRALADKRNAVVALDLRGNGFSGEQGDVESLERQIADIRFVLGQIRGSYPDIPVYLLGHSLGAGYVLRFVFSYPAGIKGIILLSPAVRTISNRSARSFLTMATMGFHILLTPRSRWDTTIGWPSALRQSELGKRILGDPACVKEFTYRYTMNLLKLSGNALLRCAASVDLPTLVIQGERDGVVVPEGAQRLYERLASTRKQIATFPNADHDLSGLLLPGSEWNEDNRKIVEVIHQWLSSES